MFFGGDPFEQFAHGHHGHHRSAREDVDTTKLYETLGISKEASAAEIKKAYRKLAVKHHPDKGGDEHKFKEISAAYEILSDSDLRAKYDVYGLDGVSEGHGDGGGPDAGDLFSMFFGGVSRGGGGSRVRKSKSVHHPLEVTLEDLYQGKTMKMGITRQVMVGEPKLCRDCRGQGRVVETRQIALGMMTQIQRTCGQCGGQGHTCKTKQERKVLEVHVPPGSKHQSKITFRGMADEMPGVEPGDVHFVVVQKPHAQFQRKGADLLIKHSISLNEAICGLEFSINHLDGRQIVIVNEPGDVILPEDASGKPFVKMVPQEGMPSRGNPFVKGNLYVLFDIEFPTREDLTPEMLQTLKATLPDPSMPLDYDEDEAETAQLQMADVTHFGKGGADMEDSDSDGDEGDRGVQCQAS